MMFLSLQPQTKNTHPVSSSSSPVSCLIITGWQHSHTYWSRTASPVAIFWTLNNTWRCLDQTRMRVQGKSELQYYRKEREIIKVGEEWVYRKERERDRLLKCRKGGTHFAWLFGFWFDTNVHVQLLHQLGNATCNTTHNPSASSR